jgi:hypothetical protein
VEREFNVDDYVALEAFFDDIGFTLIDPDFMSMEKQMEYVRNADVVACLTGSGSVHSVYSKDEGTFILVDFNTNYRFPHPALVKFCSSNPIIIFDREIFDDGKRVFMNKVFSFNDWKKYFLKLGLKV